MRQLTDSFDAALDARLSRSSDRPIALALSGGGDSVALAYLASAWAKRRGRRLLCLTVDHDLHRDSKEWTAAAGRLAHALGAGWAPLEWKGPKPDTGLPAAARQARHALLAAAARRAGARLMLTGHTADDVVEGEWMRSQGVAMGTLRDWSPSPVWPQGRGVMILRPLLRVSRTRLREFLHSRGAEWLEDPANADARFMRSRARAALALAPVDTGEMNPTAAPAQGMTVSGPSWAGLLTIPRRSSLHALSSALLSASGGAVPPRGKRLRALHQRLATEPDVVATLGGARMIATGANLLICREPGGRKGLAERPMGVGQAVIWDGRFEITVEESGWHVGGLKGRMAALDKTDAAAVRGLPPDARPTLPVLFRDDRPRPVLAWRVGRTRCLVADRLMAAVGGIGHEDDLDRAIGEMPPPDLFVHQDTDHPSADRKSRTE